MGGTRDKLAPGRPSRYVIIAFAVVGYTVAISWLVDRLTGA